VPRLFVEYNNDTRPNVRISSPARSSWRFFPALQDDKPVASTIEIRIPISVK